MPSAPFIQKTPMPGLRLSAGITLTMLSIVVLLPIGALLLQGASFGPANIWQVVTRDRVAAALLTPGRAVPSSRTVPEVG